MSSNLMQENGSVDVRVWAPLEEVELLGQG